MRDEADRLVAAAIAAISYAARGFGTSRAGAGFATGSAECCVCPVCRAIAALRDPAPEFADRLAAGVSDLAAGVTSVLRTLQRSGERDAAPQRPAASEGDEFWESLRRKAADAAKAAARAASTVDPTARMSTVDNDPWRAATAEPEPPAPRKAVVKKAVARKAPVPAPAVPAQPTVAKKAAAKKAAAKTAVAKKAAPRRATGSAREPGA